MNLQIFDSIAKIDPVQWQKITPPEFPFAKHDFLLALEESHCLGRRTGWQPVFITLWKADELQGAMPLYSKTNSYGEFIFDFAWAQAYDSVGIEYYPKLTSAIPFTSATGPKLLLASDLTEIERTQVRHQLLTAANELTTKTGASSLHALFITEKEISHFRNEGFFIRHSFQYHWQNENYASFNDFLQKFRSKRRNEAQRERRQARESGVKISRLTGNQLTAKHADAMYLFYESTADKKGGFSYLTQEFFRRIFASMREHILFVLAENADGEPVAGALNFFTDTTLFGRNWGSLEDYKSLHLEICYYQGIEFCIERKMQLFEAGAQGEHKFQRGFLPRLTYSAHQFEDARLGSAIGQFIEQEKRQIELLFEDYQRHTPFSRAE